MARSTLPVLCLLAAVPVGGQSAPALPRHPSELVFPPAAWRPPAAAGARIELPGGPLVFFVEDRSLPLFDLVAAARVGSFLDPAERPGLATVAVELLPRGGSAALDADRFDAAVERLGGRVTARAGATNSAVGVDGPSRVAAQLVELFLDLLAEPGLDADRLHHLEASLREAMRRRNDDPLQVLEREWEMLLYGPDHFSTRALVPADLDRLERGDLLAFHRRAWRPENLILAVSGDLDRRSFLERLRERVAAWPGPAADSLPWPPPSPTGGAGAGGFLLPWELPQTKVIVGHRLSAVRRDDRPALALLAEVLGGRGAVSRIQGRLRTAEGLVYRSVTTIEAGELWPGELRVLFETRPEGAVRAVELVREELERIRARPVPEPELEAARAALLASLRTDFDTPEEVAGRLAENALFGRADDHWPARYEAIEAVRADRVREVAARYLRPDELTVLVLGSLDDDARARLSRLVGAPLEILPERDAETQEEARSRAGLAPAREGARWFKRPRARARRRRRRRRRGGSRPRAAAHRAPACRGR